MDRLLFLNITLGKPREAIEVAKRWLSDPTEKNRNAAESARNAALDKIETWILSHIKEFEEIKKQGERLLGRKRPDNVCLIVLQK